MKKSTLWNIICAAVLGLQLIAEGFALAIILRLNMLPGIYTAALIAMFGLLGLLSGLLLFLHRKGKQVGTVRRIIACILAFLIVCGCAAVTVVVSQVYDTMHGITNPTVEKVTRSIYVRMEDPAQSLADAADYTFAIVDNYDVESTQQAIAVIESELGKEIPVECFLTITDMIDALYEEQVDAIILNSSYIAILEDNPDYADFTQKARILHDVPVVGWTAPTETVAPEPTEEPAVIPDVTNTPFIMYISGSDTRSSYLPTSTRSDVNILVVVNPVTKQVLLLNTPRDYYVENPAGNGVRDKLTHCGVYGIDCSIKALENLYNLDVDYFAKINFSGFETMIDAVGGVTVYSDVSFTACGATWISAGENYLNGKEALDFSRERYTLAGGDNARGKNQMKVIKAVIEKLTSGTTIIANYSAILDSMKGMFTTSMEMLDISMLVKMQLSDMARWNILSYAVTGQNGSNVTYSAPGEYLSIMYVNDELVAHAADLVDRVIAGEILTEEDLKD